jgi:asparagine synthetase B (glutamine-hydrolysing)
MTKAMPSSSLTPILDKVADQKMAVTLQRRQEEATIRQLREVYQLVDTLQQRTSYMMTFEGNNLLAFLGGVDSSLVAALLQQYHTTQQSSRT